ncbi:MAG: 30S ribosomal protein S7 [Planctomycetota bacterium]
MGRGFTKSEEQLKPDPRYNDKVLSRFINCLMHDGKKSVAQRVVYRAFDEIDKRLEGDEVNAIDIFRQAIENVKPNVEVRSKRVGGANYQVPMQVKPKRKQALAFRWILQAARSERGKPMHMRLGRELMEASRGEGKAMNTRDQTHRMAEANKAFAHFAW